MSKRIAPCAVLLLILGAAACDRSTDLANASQNSTTLTVGFGLPTSEDAPAGIKEMVRGVTLERLVTFSSDGRPQARLAERWSVSPDGLSVRLWLRSGATFHNGQPVTADAVRDALRQRLPASLGPAFEDIREIRATGEHEVELLLHRRSRFVFEGLEIPVQQAGKQPIGTGPFYAVNRTDDVVEMRANEHYYGGKPAIDRILFKSYDSVRAAWAEMLRGQVDMLYETGIDALDSLQPSTQTRIFTFDRPYEYMIMLNVQKPILRDKIFRRALNAAIDRRALVEQILNGHGTPADSPVWPKHWALSAGLPTLNYEPRPIAGARRPRFVCMVEPSTERVALFVQRQLQAVGVDLELQSVSLREGQERMEAGEFDAFLVDAAQGPTMIRPYWFWHSGGPYNWGRFSSKEVDAALDAMRDAPGDDAYRAGVAAFQTALVDDPPAIFLAWTQRARAVSTKFAVPAEPGLDIISSLRLWRPGGHPQTARRN